MNQAADHYLETLVLPESEGEDHGPWIICASCESCWRPDADEHHDASCPVGRVRELEAENARLREHLRLDQSGLAASLVSIQRLLAGYGWLGELGQWGAYDDEDRGVETLRIEIRDALSQISCIAGEGLVRSGTLVTYALNHASVSPPPTVLLVEEIEHLLWAWASAHDLNVPPRSDDWSAEHARVLGRIAQQHPGLTPASAPRILAMLVALDVRRRGAADLEQAVQWLRSDDAARRIRGLTRGEARDRLVLNLLADALASAYAEQLCLPPIS